MIFNRLEMKKLLVFTLVLWVGMAKAQAQDNPQDDAPKLSKETMAKVEAARIALITERLELTPEQAEKFWPVYRQYTEERKALLQDLGEIRREARQGNIGEEKSKELVNKTIELKQKEASLEKVYSDRLMKVISAQQLMALKRAEVEFRNELIRRIQQRRDTQMRRQDLRDRRDEFQKEKRGN